MLRIDYIAYRFEHALIQQPARRHLVRVVLMSSFPKLLITASKAQLIVSWMREITERLVGKLLNVFMDSRESRLSACQVGASNSTSFRRGSVGFLAIFRGDAALVLTLKDAIGQSRRAI
jgi:hypothetical protein